MGLIRSFRVYRETSTENGENHPNVYWFDEWMNVLGNIDPFYRPVAETIIITGMIGSEIAKLRREGIQR